MVIEEKKPDQFLFVFVANFAFFAISPLESSNISRECLKNYQQCLIGQTLIAAFKCREEEFMEKIHFTI